MFNLLYSVVLAVYRLGISIGALYNPKAKGWIQGRKSQDLDQIGLESKVWIHCASVGEFEQALPLIEWIKNNTDLPVLVSFFSPSGFNNAKSDLVDYKVYIPLDFMGRMSKFIERVNPKVALFVKYELWKNTLSILRRSSIPTYLVSAAFRPEQVYFRWYAKPFLNEVKAMSKVFVQDAGSLQQLESNGFNNAMLVGDTRYERVSSIAQQPFEAPFIQRDHDRKLIMAGSTWVKDEEHLFKFLAIHKDKFQIVMAPHELHRDFQPLKNNDLNLKLLSEGGVLDPNSDVLVVDKMGMLSKLYRFADLSYIGGGFGFGTHNILESLVYGIPVICGPNYTKFVEINDATAQGVAFSIGNSNELEECILDVSGRLAELKPRIEAFMDDRMGATEKMAKAIFAD